MVGAVTTAVMVQVEPPTAAGAVARFPPVTVIDEAVFDSVPPQVVLVGPTMVTPAGRLSVKL